MQRVNFIDLKIGSFIGLHAARFVLINLSLSESNLNDIIILPVFSISVQFVALPRLRPVVFVLRYIFIHTFDLI